MSFTNSETPLLIAPRPVRLSSNSNSFLARPAPNRFTSAPDAMERSPSSEDFKIGWLESSKENDSPRTSPRSVLPSEALEEFLSILKPSFGPSYSPVSRRQVSMPMFMQDSALRLKSRMDRVQSRVDMDGFSDVDRTLATLSRNTMRTPSPNSDDLDIPASLRWFSANILSSPVSRNNTRNPFQRHASYALYPTSQSPRLPSLPMTPLSPAAVPLPLPSSDEAI